MVQWTLEKDGWYYSQDKVRRWKARPDGSIAEEMVPQGPTLTDQQFIKDCDVNEILSRIAKTNQMPANFGATGVYADFTEIQDLQESMHTVARAQEAFAELPANIRLKFQNDPNQLIQYLNDPANIKESVELGLRVRTNAPDPVVEQLSELNKNLTAQADKPKRKHEKTESEA